MAKKILVVDDEVHIIRILSDTLTRRGYDVVTGADGREAVELALAEHPDLIFLDVMMPNMSGFEACQVLRRDHGLEVPIFLLTARGQERDVAEGEAAGATCYLTKPFSPRRLADLVDEALAGP
jgi:DNA-binding response OmpR family regulator